ncbi:uncharacterized protein LOC128759461 isoform X2 [Synchiropus splendidus]|uniref:uncharacterized protein LOC128759461 isoform X2 n=1 Tax=Synchiropus splendidus TaxID=270530 RepID=UPI00237E4A46|nr:uncharacterized protein LOC128759461 isoform X2 [Synchiropus splendidus]
MDPTTQYPPVNYSSVHEPDLFLSASTEYGNLHVKDNFHDTPNNGNYVHHLMYHDNDDHNYSRNVNDDSEVNNRDINNNVLQFDDNNQNENADLVDVVDVMSGAVVDHSPDEFEEDPVSEERPTMTLRIESELIWCCQEWFDTPHSSADNEDVFITEQHNEQNVVNEADKVLQPGGNRKRRREEDGSEAGQRSSKHPCSSYPSSHTLLTEHI